MMQRGDHVCAECGARIAPFGMRLMCAGGFVWACRDHRAAVFAAHDTLRPARDRSRGVRFDADGQGVLI